MMLNFALLSLLPLALGASTVPGLNPAFCNQAGGDPRALRVCFLNLFDHDLFENYTTGLKVAYSADHRYVLVTMDSRTYDGMLDSEKAIYSLTRADDKCTDVKISTTTKTSYKKKVCNGDGFVIMGV